MDLLKLLFIHLLINLLRKNTSKKYLEKIRVKNTSKKNNIYITVYFL
jgi:hypothetical protein